MIELVLEEAEEKMTNALDATKREFARIRTGKASPSLLDGIRVEYYGSQLPIRQVANVSAPEPRLLVVQPWDREALAAIEKAINKSEIGLNPINDGVVLRLPIPALTEERRRDLVKQVKRLAEEGRVSVRNARRQQIEELRELQKDGDITEDELHKGMDQIQRLTDTYIEQLEQILRDKEDEIMEV